MTAPLRLCLVDMNNGVANQATRCFRRVFDAFQTRVRAVNPDLEMTFRHVQPRNLGELPTDEVDLVLSSGGPGSPFDGYDEAWSTGYRKFLDRVVERNLARPGEGPGAFLVCHSFELGVLHFGVAKMEKRRRLKFGVMPAYPTAAGQESEFLGPFGERLFVWEHRSWEAVDLDLRRLRALGGELLARESRPGRSDKGSALVAFKFAPGVAGTQFHPEADKAGVVNWIYRPEHKNDLEEAYGAAMYERMLKTLSDPERLARTYALLIPSWLTHRFNEIARARGLNPIDAPVQDASAFDDEKSGPKGKLSLAS